MEEIRNFNLLNKKNIVLLMGFYIMAIPFQKIIWLPRVNSKIQVSEIIFIFIFILLILQLKDFIWKNTKIIALDKAIILWLFIGIINLISNLNLTTLIEFSGQFYLVCLYFLIQFLFITFRFKEIESFFISSFILQLFFIIITLLLGIILLTQHINLGVFQIFYSYPYFGDIYRLKVLTNEPVMLVSVLNIPFWIIAVSLKMKVKVIQNKKWSDILLLLLTGLMLIGTLGKSLPFILAIMIFYFTIRLNYKKQGTFFIKIFSGFLILSSIFFTHIIVTKKSLREKQVYGLIIPFSKVDDFYFYKSWYFVQKENAIKEFIEHPFFGCGGGNLLNVINLKYKESEETISRPVYDPLSTYTGVLAEYGILGFLALLFLMFTIYKEVVRLPDNNGLKWIFICSFSYFMLEAISTDIQNFRHVWILLGFFGITLRNQQFPVNS